MGNLFRIIILHPFTPFFKLVKLHLYFEFAHTLAFHMIKAGVNIVTVQDFLGHEDINTTSQYIKIDNQMKANAIEKNNPFVGSKIKALWEK